MTAADWSEVRDLFGDACELPPDHRSAFVRERATTHAIAEATLRLLDRFGRLGSFLEDGSGDHDRTNRASASRSCVVAGIDDPGTVSAGPSGLAGGGPASFTSTGDERAAADRLRPGRGALVASRYELGPKIASGGFGPVHCARDRVSGGEVAIKILRCLEERDRRALHSEIAMLRRARLPGLAELLDETTEHGWAYVVMRLVRGEPFPGPGLPRDAAGGVPWDALAPRAIALAEALARLHGTGIVHRDLKQDNVLVGADGTVTILDLGVSCDGRAVPEGLAGTFEYLAPEVLTQVAPPSVASDLWSLGLLLAAALGGGAPRPGDDDGLPAAPPHVVRALRALLSENPDGRPRTARAAAAMLRGEDSIDEPRLPFAGTTDVVEAVVAAACAGRPADIAGPPGSGRTRTLDEAIARLTDAGRVVARTVPSAEPFGSLVPVLGPVPATTLAAARRWAADGLARRLGDRVVVAADDFARLDGESRAAIETVCSAGAVLRVLDGEAAGALRPAALTGSDLGSLFHGPDRLLHLREDAARELLRRTGGRPAVVVREIAAWLDGGIARMDGDRLVIDRAGIERLQTRLATSLPASSVAEGLAPAARAVLAALEVAACEVPIGAAAEVAGLAPWAAESAIADLCAAGLAQTGDGPMVRAVAGGSASAAWTTERRLAAHRTFASRLPRADARRLAHLEAAGDLETCAIECAEAARDALQDGRPGAALDLAGESLSLGRAARCTSPGLVVDALDVLVESALGLATSAAIEFAAHHAGLAAVLEPRARTHETLCRAALWTLQGDAQRAVAALAEPVAGRDDGAERLRHVVRTRAARLAPRETERRVLADLAAAARRSDSRSCRTLFLASLAWHRYRTGAFERAAALHGRSARRATNRITKLNGILSAASAALECGRHADAAAWARSAASLAATLRVPQFEARAEWILRCAAYREGTAAEPDLGFVEAVKRIGSAQLVQLVALNEAAVAWRLGNLALARSLAADSACADPRAARSAPRLLARAIAVAASSPVRRDEADAILADTRGGTAAGIVLQIAGLLAGCGSESMLRDLWDSHGPRIAASEWDRRREVLSLGEAALRGGRAVGR